MTYSIVARDKETWDMWIAVQTHWFWVGNNVPWLKSGVWAIATQALTEMRYWYEWLEILEEWKTPEELLKIIWSKDEAYESRQVAIIENNWNIATHTGADCVNHAGSIVWDGFVVQWNILTNDKVLQAMFNTYEENSDKPFCERLLLTLQWWQDAWGEIRWQQSSALCIVGNRKWEIPKIKLQVDNSSTPIKDLKDNLNIFIGYDYLKDAEDEWTVWDIEKSLKLFQKAKELLPNNKEVLFWEASMLYNRWRIDKSKKIFDTHFKWEENWQELWDRITW